MPKGDFGFNGTISGKGIGTRRIRVVQLDMWLGIIATSGEARKSRAFYPVVTTGSSFVMGVAFVSYEEREAFSVWLEGYARSLANNKAKSGVMTIRVPYYDFTRVAVWEGEMEHGEAVTDVGYVLSMPFIGATDPVNLDLGSRMAGISYFKGPKGDQESQYFYPAGRQIRGAESLDGTLFDPVPSGNSVPHGDPAEDTYGDDFGAGGL
jgi:hypothetical protein